MADLDSEIQAHQEEIRQQLEAEQEKERNYRAELASRNQQQKNAKQAVKKAVKKQVVKRAVWPVIAAVAEFLAPYVLIIIVVIAIMLLIVAVLVALCNEDGLLGSAVRLGSTVGSWINVLPVDFCNDLKVSPATNAVNNAYQQTQGAMCNTPDILAQQNNESYPAQTDPDLQKMLNCISAAVGGNTGQVYTYDQTYKICNYTRGDRTCGTCSHSKYSCHYGGTTGTTGALAADFAVIGQAGVNVLKAAQTCSTQLSLPLKRSTCEDASANAVPCTASGATHVHMSISKCSSDNGPINNQ